MAYMAVVNGKADLQLLLLIQIKLRLQVDRTQFGPVGHQARSRDSQLVILDIDDDLDEANTRGEAEGASSDVDTRLIKRDASLYETFAMSELAFMPTKSIDTSGLYTPTFQNPRSIKAPQNEIQSRERNETTGGRLDELRDASRYGTPAQDLE
ncbi:hypothetical protein NA56DRAFT_660485 [Hyaloscypha hepaticicola]|uniref:Uncharacterized protein n=1 Tax=Hyaloscypha hepaticicola TaxID=2082293 RepID=A0A2J6PZ70_9HELO|nr:hypothetical protein NA56DRAFT_660485 [Hyaloscypha hepaticicola]